MIKFRIREIKTYTTNEEYVVVLEILNRRLDDDVPNEMRVLVPVEDIKKYKEGDIFGLKKMIMKFEEDD